MTRKAAATTFLKMAGTGDVANAYAKFIASNFIHHNQFFKGDRQSLMVAMQEAHAASPNKSVEVKYVYEDGDTVITHSLVTRVNPDEPDIAVIHIFKFENDEVVELWDLGELIAKDSPNENGMF